jgi:poly-gamma-glutamate synthesis protein (capsule biosynthesis protein)
MNTPNTKIALLARLAAIAAILAACNLPATAAPQSPNTTLTPFQPGSVQAEQATETQAALEPSLWISPALPELFTQAALGTGMELAAEESTATAKLAVNEGETVATWIYALVAPFPTITEDVSFDDLQAAWHGEQAGPFAGRPLMLTADTQAVFVAWWGEPAAGATQVEEPAALLDAAWAAQPAWALVPFEKLGPRWKVLSVEGQSPIWKSFDPGKYALTVPIGLTGANNAALGALPATNRDSEKLTTVILTGVTALVRATAWEMERKGVTYPAEDIGAVMREADIAHISNEVPFAENCPPPDPSQRTLVFCSAANYIDLLDAVGADVIELTGDHFNDWTRDAMLFTLDLYKERGWPYYGGGANIDEAKLPLLLEDHGNKIAFIGCNGKGGGYASAKADYPGTWACDYDYMEQTTRDLVAQGYMVIATFQHNEVYTYVPQPGLIRDFGRLALAGASVVSGSQAHQPHGVEFTDDDTLITYGLGNLFFDQIIFGYDTSHAMLVRHVFYDNHYISAELLPIVFVDYAKPRFLNAEERAEFLQIIFDNSIWEPRAEETQDGN